MIFFASVIETLYPWLQKGLWVLEVVIAFGLLVGIHEFGHFISAKLTGMKVEEFSIGFGKMLLGVKYGETQYSIRIVPLGGYCKIFGMEDDGAADPEKVEEEIPEEDIERGFNRKPLWARLIVIVAGSFMNVVMAIVLVGFMGVSIGYNYSLIEEVEKGSPADKAGIKAGDKIRNFAYSSSRGEIIESVANSNTAKGIEFRINRDDESQLVKVYPTLTTDENGEPVKRIGIRFSTDSNFAPIIDRVMYDSPFQRAGLKPGDEIASVNRGPVKSMSNVYDALLETDSNGEVNLEVVRNEMRYPLSLKDHLIYRTGMIAETVLAGDGETWELVVTNAIMDTPAFYLGLTKGWRVTEIDGMPITSDFNWAIHEAASDAKEFMIKVYDPRRDDPPVVIPLSRIMLHPGISFKAHYIKVPFFASLHEAVLQTKAYSLMIFDFLGSLFSKKAGIQEVAGPIGIAQIGYRMASSGLFNLLSFFTIISVNLAIINMLPLPGLDGGRTVFLIIEFLIRKPVIGPRKENIIHLVGLLLFLCLFLYVCFNDVGRLINTY